MAAPEASPLMSARMNSAASSNKRRFHAPPRLRIWYSAFADRYLNRKNVTIMSALVVMVLARTVDQTLYYRLNFSYRYFVWYFGAVILPLPITWIVVWYKMLFTKDITPEMRAFPQYKFAIMALFDALFNIFSTFPVQHLGGDLSNALSQSILPINMFLSFVFLRTRFKGCHYLGATLAVYGILVKLSPSLGTNAFSGSIGWIILFVVAQLPAAGSNVYKETGMKGAQLDSWYASSWIAVWQLLWGVLSIWTIFIPVFVDPYPAITFDNLGDYFEGANSCFFGKTTDVHSASNSSSFISDCLDHDNTYNYDTATCLVDCNQEGSPLSVYLVYIIFNLTYNVLSLYIFKKGSAVMFVVASAVRLPLVDMLNSVQFVSGQAQEDLGVYDFFSLFILVLAIVVYNQQKEIVPGSKDESDEEGSEDGKEIYSVTAASGTAGAGGFTALEGTSAAERKTEV